MPKRTLRTRQRRTVTRAAPTETPLEATLTQSVAAQADASATVKMSESSTDTSQAGPKKLWLRTLTIVPCTSGGA